MSRTQKNKATEGHLGQLKARLAKLRTEVQEGNKKVHTLQLFSLCNTQTLLHSSSLAVAVDAVHKLKPCVQAQHRWCCVSCVCCGVSQSSEALTCKRTRLCTQHRVYIDVQSGGAGEGFEVQKYGDGRVALIGFPSVGKSSLLNLLTGTESEAAAYEFTTLTCIPGVVHYKGTKIQLLDLPGIIEGAAAGKASYTTHPLLKSPCNRHPCFVQTMPA